MCSLKGRLMRNGYSVRTFTSSLVPAIGRSLGLAFLILLALGAIKISTYGQTSSGVVSSQNTTIANERYRELYDVIFPRRTNSSKGFVLFRLILRYTTSRGPDFQHEVTKFEDGRVVVVFLECSAGLNSYLKLRAPIETISRAEFERVKGAAKRIPVVRKEFALPADRLRELSDSFNSLPFPRLAESNSIFFDGTGYKLWVQTGAEELSYSVGAESLGAEKISFPIVKWMNQAHELLSNGAVANKRE
jgi:hypothetical protein